MADKKKDNGPKNEERLYGDDIGDNVDTNAGPDASDGGVANESVPGQEK